MHSVGTVTKISPKTPFASTSINATGAVLALQVNQQQCTNHHKAKKAESFIRFDELLMLRGKVPATDASG